MDRIFCWYEVKRKTTLCINKGIIYEEDYCMYDWKHPWKYFKVGNYLKQRHMESRMKKIATRYEVEKISKFISERAKEINNKE